MPQFRSPPSLVRARAPWLSAAVLAWALFFPQNAEAKTHTVYKGQRLGSIAKRYKVSIDALCRANGIRRSDPIHPGQKLVIPEKGSESSAPKKREAKKPNADSDEKKLRKGWGKPTIHEIARGQTLGGIARRYGVSVSAICHASGISRQATLRVGQPLIVPAKTDPDGAFAARLRENGDLSRKLQDKSSDDDGRGHSGSPSWKPYQKAPWRRGYIDIQGYSRSFKGYVIGPGNKVLPRARERISRVLGAAKKGPLIDTRLIYLLARVSDTFGGRPIRIVSGYRQRSYVHDSKHKVGRALDFSVPGVPNEALRDYVRTLGSVGVGYYPNSTFVHLDVRPSPAYWVDYAGPGEPPRKTPGRVATTRPGKAASTAPDTEPESDDDSANSDEQNQESSEASEQAKSDSGGSESETAPKARPSESSERKAGPQDAKAKKKTSRPTPEKKSTKTAPAKKSSESTPARK